jgi:hypothetical protein
MSTGELSNWCRDCNRPSIETRCDECQRHHDMEEAGGPRSSESQFEGIHHGDARTVEVVWGPDVRLACGWYWLPVLESSECDEAWCGPFATSRAAVENADIDGVGDEYPDRYADGIHEDPMNDDEDDEARNLAPLDGIGTLCLRILDAADLNPFSFGPGEYDPDQLGRDEWNSEVLATEDDESFARDCFNGSGLMGGCYMPAVTYHSAERIAPYAPHLIAADLQRAADWGIEPGIVHNRERMNLGHWPSLCVFLACMAIEEIARQIDEARESREEVSR